MKRMQDPAARARRARTVLRGHDPVDFPFYGLDPAWEGVRYIQDLEVEDGRPLRALGLGHHTRDHQAWVLVSSAPRSARDQWFRRDDDAGEAGAMVALNLIESQRPSESLRQLTPERLGEYHGVVFERIDELAAAASTGQWTRTLLDVEGVAQEARLWRHARGWGAFLLGLPEVVVRVVAVGIEPHELSLSRVEPSGYHFDPAERLSVDRLARRRRTHPDERLPLEHTEALHTDHHELADRAGITLD